jgi:hypothetical protein
VVCEGTSRERPAAKIAKKKYKKIANVAPSSPKFAKKMPQKSREIHFSLFFCTVVLLLSKVLTVCWIGHHDVVVLNLLSGINSATVDGGSTHRETHPSLGTTILQHASTGSLKVTKRVGLSHWPWTCATAPCLFYCNANEKQP